MKLDLRASLTNGLGDFDRHTKLRKKLIKISAVRRQWSMGNFMIAKAIDWQRAIKENLSSGVLHISYIFTRFYVHASNAEPLFQSK